MGNPIFFNALSSDQARQMVDAAQIHHALRQADAALAGQFAGSMRWRAVAGKDYLYRIRGESEKSLGPRSPETEATEAAFRQGKDAAQERRDGLRTRLEGIAPVNVALALNRVPDVIARIIRRLDAAALMGPRVAVVGTNALFAYEARAGVQFQSGLLATSDVDFALDARRSLTLAADMPPSSMIGLLQQIDRTFKQDRDGDFRAVNSRGFMVDLITPMPRDPMRAAKHRRISTSGADLEAIEIEKLQWLIEAPRFYASAIGENGLPLHMAVPDPRFFAAHKLWMSTRPDREPEKRGRDQQQGIAVAHLLAGPLSSLPLTDDAISQLPRTLRDLLRSAVATAPKADLQW